MFTTELVGILRDDSTFKFMMSSRAFRSVGLIYMTLAAPLYLSLINLDIIQIGFVYVAVMIFAMLLLLLIGAFGDRYGYKKALLIGEIPPILGAIGLAISPSKTIIIISIVIAGITGLAGGMRGAFSPGTTAFIAGSYDDDNFRVKRLSQLTVIASLFSVFGAAILISQSYLNRYVSSVDAYRLLFMVSAVMLIVSFISLLFVKEAKRMRKRSRVMQRKSLRYTLNMMSINTLNGAGVGMALPLLPLIFSRVFHFPVADTALYVGVIYIPSYLTTLLGSWLSNRYSKKLDVLKVASAARIGVGSITVLLAGVFAMEFFNVLTFLPLLATATFVYALRSFVAGFGSPSASTISIKGVHNEDYGTAVSIQGIASNLSQTTSGIGGYMADFMLPSPILIGGLLQVVSGIMYPKLLSKSLYKAEKRPSIDDDQQLHGSARVGQRQD